MQGSWAGHSAGTYDAFNVVDPGWSHYNDQHLAEWSVWFDGTDKFYLQYSAVPEPSTLHDGNRIAHGSRSLLHSKITKEKAGAN